MRIMAISPFDHLILPQTLTGAENAIFIIFLIWHRVSRALLWLISKVHKPSARSFPYMHLG